MMQGTYKVKVSICVYHYIYIHTYTHTYTINVMIMDHEKRAFKYKLAPKQLDFVNFAPKL